MDSEEYYNPFNKITTSLNNCFLCGNSIDNNSTVEHIFPKWLLNKYDLWDDEIVLLNRTSIKYKNLTIPCCQKCNGEFLSRIENTIRNGIEGGYEEFIKIDELVIFQWVTKIYFGLFFKELSLYIDRSDKTKGTIVTTPEFIKRFDVLHGFMQSIVKPFQFSLTNPWSIFILRTQKFNSKSDFDYSDGMEVLTFSIRMGEVSLIVCFQDNGTQKNIVADLFKKFEKIKLHPIQFDELVAKVMYAEFVRNRIPTYLTLAPNNDEDTTHVISLPLQGMSSKPVYDDWDQKEYAYFLSRVMSKWGLTIDEIFREPNLTMSWLFNQNEKINVMDIDGRIIDEI